MSTDNRCDSTFMGVSCQLANGHKGAHSSQPNLAVWLDPEYVGSVPSVDHHMTKLMIEELFKDIKL